MAASAPRRTAGIAHLALLLLSPAASAEDRPTAWLLGADLASCDETCAGQEQAFASERNCNDCEWGCVEGHWPSDPGINGSYEVKPKVGELRKIVHSMIKAPLCRLYHTGDQASIWRDEVGYEVLPIVQNNWACISPVKGFDPQPSCGSVPIRRGHFQRLGLALRRICPCGFRLRQEQVKNGTSLPSKVNNGTTSAGGNSTEEEEREEDDEEEEEHEQENGEGDEEEKEVEGSWSISGSGCVADGDCITSLNYPLWYSSYDSCTVTIDSPELEVTVEAFYTEGGSDYLTMGGVPYAGSSGPASGLYSGTIDWSSDGREETSGWKICKVESGANGTAENYTEVESGANGTAENYTEDALAAAPSSFSLPSKVESGANGTAENYTEDALAAAPSSFSLPSMVESGANGTAENYTEDALAAAPSSFSLPSKVESGANGTADNYTEDAEDSAGHVTGDTTADDWRWQQAAAAIGSRPLAAGLDARRWMLVSETTATTTTTIMEALDRPRLLWPILQQISHGSNSLRQSWDITDGGKTISVTLVLALLALACALLAIVPLLYWRPRRARVACASFAGSYQQGNSAWLLLEEAAPEAAEEESEPP